MGSTSLVQQTPGDPREPTGGEPTIMAFRRPADRPASSAGKSQSASSQSHGDDDSLPVVLRLPDLNRGQAGPVPVTPAGPARPWIGIAMWCATGALAVVAAVLIFTGKPEAAPPTEEAPQWRATAAPTSAEHTRGVGEFEASRPVDETIGSPVADATSSQAVNGFSAAPPSQERGPYGQPPAEPLVPNDAAPTNGPPPSIAPGDTFRGSPYPGNNGPGSSVPTGDPRGPVVEPGEPKGISDPWFSKGPPDQSKLQTGDVRTAVRPNTARFDGGIQNIETRPTTR